MRFVISIFVIFALLGCTMEPRYQKPTSPVQLEEKQLSQVSKEEFFENKEIQDLLKKTLENNRDLKISYLSIELAREAYNIQKSALLPSINGGSNYSNSSAKNTEMFQSGLILNSFELDFFGKARSLSKAKKEAFLSSEESANILRISLTAEVSNSFIKYLTLKQNVSLLKQNLTLNEEKYLLLKAQQKLGYISNADLLTAKNSLEQNKIDLQNQEILLNQAKTALTLLAGADITESLNSKLKISDVKLNEDKLNFAPSSILLSRPDVMQAEHDLKSANANIGAARANFFPSISLTGMYGFASTSLSSLFSNTAWQYSSSSSVPIFNGGRNIANLKISKAQKEVAILRYEKSIQTAFKEVLDALFTREALSLELKSSNQMLQNSKNLHNIQKTQYESGAISKIDFINAVMLFNASQISFNAVRQNYISSVIVVYKVTGQGI